MQDLLFIYFTAFITGILTTFQPCIFPLLPTYISYMTSYEEKPTEGLIASIFLTLGLMIVFLTLALLIKVGFSEVGSFLTRYTIEFNLIIALMLLFFGLLMLFNKDITLFYRLPSLAQGILTSSKDNNYYAAFFLGLSYTAIAAPCAAPIFLSLLSIILLLDPINISVIIFVYSVGAGLPFLIMGTFVPDMKNKIKVDYNNIAKWIKPFSGYILLIMSFYIANVYVFPYYPINVISFQWRGLNSDVLTISLVLLIGIPLIAISGFFIIVYGKFFSKGNDHHINSEI